MEGRIFLGIRIVESSLLDHGTELIAVEVGRRDEVRLVQYDGKVVLFVSMGTVSLDVAIGRIHDT